MRLQIKTWKWKPAEFEAARAGGARASWACTTADAAEIEVIDDVLSPEQMRELYQRCVAVDQERQPRGLEHALHGGDRMRHAGRGQRDRAAALASAARTRDGSSRGDVRRSFSGCCGASTRASPRACGSPSATTPAVDRQARRAGPRGLTARMARARLECPGDQRRALQPPVVLAALPLRLDGHLDEAATARASPAAAPGSRRTCGRPRRCSRRLFSTA